MPKNVVIFSDGTGQVGGINFDEDRTNIYKLYRACRVAPDSPIEPSRQVAFYDPGLGSVAEGPSLIGRAGRSIYNMVSQATGLGITANIIDCYAALIRLWRPGDRIYLFGFSRGAYTVRCLASIIAMCGIPQADGRKQLRLDYANSRRIARRAVKSVYQFTHSVQPEKASRRQRELLAQRSALARQFREQFKSSDPADADKANVYPHFVGVFDTVTAIATRDSMRALMIACLIATAVIAGIVKLGPLPPSVPILGHLAALPYLAVWLAAIAAGAVAAGLAFLLKSIRWTRDLPGTSWARTLHLVQIKQQFRDYDLNEHVGYARHAIAIDENRAEFARVPWGFRDAKHESVDAAGIAWFQQLWFAGNHADVGGGYPENESRLSDCTLDWMVREARAVGLEVDAGVLRLHPSCDGMQHDEVATGLGLLTQWFGKTWRRRARSIPDAGTTVHESVYDRFECGEVLQHDIRAPYRPRALEGHDDFFWKYLTVAGSSPRPRPAPAPPDPSAPRPTKEQPDRITRGPAGGTAASDSAERSDGARDLLHAK
jgi:uncharacterized protein (DUF2235 family)